MRRIAAVALGSAALIGTLATPAIADGEAIGTTHHSPGVASGNLIQVPVDAPIIINGNSINVVGLNNPAFGNKGIND